MGCPTTFMVCLERRDMRGLTHEPRHYASITCTDQRTYRNKRPNAMYPSLTHYEGEKVNESIK